MFAKFERTESGSRLAKFPFILVFSNQYDARNRDLLGFRGLNARKIQPQHQVQVFKIIFSGILGVGKTKKRKKKPPPPLTERKITITIFLFLVIAKDFPYYIPAGVQLSMNHFRSRTTQQSGNIEVSSQFS